MSARNLIIVCASGIFAFALALGWFGLRSARRAQAARLDISRERMAVAAVLEKEKHRMDAFSRNREPPRARAGARAAVTARGDADLSALLAANPDLYALGVRVYRANLGLHFGPLYRSLGMSPAQIEKFEDLMTAHQEEMLDLEAAASSRGLIDSDPAVAGYRQQAEDRLRTAQVALLGADGFGQLQQLNRTEPVGDIVGNVATTVALTATPLTAAQAEQLTRFLADASRSYRSGDPADPSTIDWDRVLSQARGVLSEPQYEALQTEYLKPQIAKMQEQFNHNEFEKN